MKQKTLLWLDDLRNPFIDIENKVPKDENGLPYNIIWARDYNEFTYLVKQFIKENKRIPDAISFDHDLAPEHYTPEIFWSSKKKSKEYQRLRYLAYEEFTGLDCAEWLTEVVHQNPPKDNLRLLVHSANPIGAKWIKKHLKKELKKYINES